MRNPLPVLKVPLHLQFVVGNLLGTLCMVHGMEPGRRDDALAHDEPCRFLPGALVNALVPSELLERIEFLYVKDYLLQISIDERHKELPRIPRMHGEHAGVEHPLHDVLFPMIHIGAELYNLYLPIGVDKLEHEVPLGLVVHPLIDGIEIVQLRLANDVFLVDVCPCRLILLGNNMDHPPRIHLEVRMVERQAGMLPRFRETQMCAVPGNRIHHRRDLRGGHELRCGHGFHIGLRRGHRQDCGFLRCLRWYRYSRCLR